mgnify:CR=1 FL=1
MFQKFLTSFMSQQWEDLLFLHWHIDPKPLASKLPDGLALDLFEGQAWISVVGFRLTQLRIKPFTRIPWRDFNEVNLRTYVKDTKGRSGVWFLSLDSTDFLAALGARIMYGLQYRYASISGEVNRNTIGYSSETTLPSAGIKAELSTDCDLLREPFRASRRGTLEYFLLERYRFWSARKFQGDLSTGLVCHSPYKFVQLPNAHYLGDLFKCQGLEEPHTAPALVHYSKGFPVTASAPSWVFGIAGHANHR